MKLFAIENCEDWTKPGLKTTFLQGMKRVMHHEGSSESAKKLRADMRADNSSHDLKCNEVPYGEMRLKTSH